MQEVNIKPNKTLSERLVLYEPLSLKKVAAFSFSFILILFSTSLMGFCDRLILARYSIEGSEASLAAFWLSQLFQLPFIRTISLTQAFVGEYKGADQLGKIGPCIWQMIWFSLLLTLIVWPISEPIGKLFFQNTTLHKGSLYFRYLILGGFLFPLGTALSAFYLGQGQTRGVLFANLTCHCLHVLLDFPLVFGVRGFLPPLGALGSIVAAITAQFFFCLYLFYGFWRAKKIYKTTLFSLKRSLLWKYLRIGIPRSITSIVKASAWVAMTRIMIGKGENFAAVLAFGGTLHLFFTCFNEGLSQALTTIGSYLIGAKKNLIWKLTRLGCLFLILEAAILTIPCLIFPEGLITLFFNQGISASFKEILILCCTWIWVLFFTEGLNLIGHGILASYGDTLFQMCFSFSIWIVCFLPAYLLIHIGNASPDRFWLISACGCLISSGIYFARILQEKWTKMPTLTTQNLREQIEI